MSEALSSERRRGGCEHPRALGAFRVGSPVPSRPRLPRLILQTNSSGRDGTADPPTDSLSTRDGSKFIAAFPKLRTYRKGGEPFSEPIPVPHGSVSSVTQQL